MLLAALSQFGFVDDIDHAIRISRVKLDLSQYEYLLALLNVPSQPMPAPGDASPRSANPPDPAAPSSSRAPPSAEIQAKVDAVLDVLPDFGRGFVEGCLQCLQWDTESTVDALLMGNVPPELAEYDRSILVNPLRAVLAAGSRNSQGKENGAAAVGLGGGLSGGLSWEQSRTTAMPSAGALQLLHQRSAAQTQRSSKYAGVTPTSGMP
jgi:hypothetical protein